MAHRICEYPEACLAFGWKSAGTKRKYRPFGGVDVIDSDVEVQLLRMIGVRPAWRRPRGYPLKRELTLARFNAYDDPVFGVLVDPHSQDRCVEGCECSRIGTVEHRLLQSSNHL